MSPDILYSGFSNFFNKKVPSRQANNSGWRHTTVNISLKRDKRNETLPGSTEL